MSFGRPSLDLDGRVVARRELRVGETVYEPGQELPADALDARQVAMHWRQGLIDTLPRKQPQQPRR